jgi:hypothetical protein
LARRKRRIEKRLQVSRDMRFVRMMSGAPPMLSSTGLKYELADKTQAIAYGGVPLMLRVARESGLVDAIDHGVPILKWRCPYYESDHVLFDSRSDHGGGFLPPVQRGERAAVVGSDQSGATQRVEATAR